MPSRDVAQTLSCTCVCSAFNRVEKRKELVYYVNTVALTKISVKAYYYNLFSLTFIKKKIRNKSI